IGIYLDGVLIQNPNVKQPIMDGAAEISGGFASFDEASNTAALLRGGALPVDIEVLSKRTVGPSLGQDSLDKSIKAAVIGMALLLLFMIGYYRLPGLLANVSLVVYSLLLLWALSLLHATLTLPGIAGFVLSIGMAVDANIIIYERLKEELKSGKSLIASIDAGFKRAFWTIFDSNITTLIAALVLFKFGTGSVQGFALTLSIGLVVNMFTAIFFTRGMLRWMASIKSFSNKKLYGA
ncbi:MAG: protein translocase subunit SecD, partial [Clostridiales bacterium]